MPSPRSIYIAFEAFPRPKGASSHIASMVRALARSHAPVWLLCCGYGDMPAWQPDGSIEIHRYKGYHPNLLRRAQGFAGFVRDRVEAAGTDVRLRVFRDPWGGVPALTYGPPSAAVFEVNALPSWELAYTYPAFTRHHALRAKLEDAERFCLRACDAVVTVSPVTRDALAAAGVPVEKMVTIPNAASPSVVRTRPPSDCRVFGYVGSLHPWQGVTTVIDALALVAGDLPGARLVVYHHARRALRKPLAKRIRKKGLEDRVELRHAVSQESIGEVFAGLRFLVAPLTETFRNTVQGCCPVKIVESMASGTPVLASNLRAVRDLVAHERDGLLVSPGDTRAWALAIRRLYRDPILVDRLGSAAREAAEKRFHIDRIHDKLDVFFGRVVARAGSGARHMMQHSG